MAGDTELVPSGTGGPKSPDVLDGGDGEDRVEYSSRRAPLTIDLTTGVGGRLGEGDTLIGVEGATGGDGADTITGTEDANFLDGAGGRDTLAGLGGARRARRRRTRRRRPWRRPRARAPEAS